MNLFRVMVPVSDLDQAAEFYAKLLETPGRAVGGGRLYFDCGPVILAALQTDRGPNPEYYYFSVSNLEEVHKRAAQLGCLSEENVHDSPAGEIIVRPWGERSFYAYDPFGNGLCFVDEQTLFTGR